MVIIGAKGFAKEILEVLFQLKRTENIVFYDDVNLDIENFLFNKYPILKSEIEAAEYFKTNNGHFTIGIGDPRLRETLFKKFTSLGGSLTSVISPHAYVGNFDITIGEGCNIMTGAILTSSISIGKGVLINLSCTIGHDCKVGDFVELSPGVKISGNCTIGNFTTIGTNATILPRINIGSNVTIGAGAVVTKDIPDNSIAVGIPAKVISTK